MGAAGFDDAELKLYKKHTSNTSFLYNRPTGQRVNAGRVASLSVDDVDSMVPVGARRRLAEQRADEDAARTNKLSGSLQEFSSVGNQGLEDAIQGQTPVEVLKITVPRALVFKRPAPGSDAGKDGGNCEGVITSDPRALHQAGPNGAQSGAISKWYAICSGDGFVGVVTTKWTEYNRLV